MNGGLIRSVLVSDVYVRLSIASVPLLTHSVLSTALPCLYVRYAMMKTLVLTPFQVCAVNFLTLCNLVCCAPPPVGRCISQPYTVSTQAVIILWSMGWLQHMDNYCACMCIVSGLLDMKASCHNCDRAQAWAPLGNMYNRSYSQASTDHKMDFRKPTGFTQSQGFYCLALSQTYLHSCGTWDTIRIGCFLYSLIPIIVPVIAIGLRSSLYRLVILICADSAC